MSVTTGPEAIGGTYSFGFMMEFDYLFETTRNPQWGYVQAEGKQPKLSFVGNSGVKFGVLESDAKPFEAAILDVQSMVGLGGGMSRFDPSQGGYIQASGDVNTGNVFQTEPLSRLMTGVRYGGD